MRKSALILSATILVALAVIAVLLPVRKAAGSNGEYHNKVATFFSMVESGKLQEGIDFIYADNPWISQKSDNVSQLKSQFVGLPSVVGEILSHDLLVEEVYSERFAYLYYFVATERQPLAFVFQFYKPEGTWMTYSFSYTGDIDEVFEEKAMGLIEGDSR